MCPLLATLLTFLMTLLRSRLALQLEIVALRHQVAVYQRSVSRPCLVVLKKSTDATPLKSLGFAVYSMLSVHRRLQLQESP
jgi:hypothetical protein